MNKKQSLNSDYFKEVYDANEDPWNFETSEYEAAKYATTIAALPKDHYENVLEIGCSIGVLTQLLAQKSTHLLATDISQKALDLAAKRCIDLKNVSFKLLNFQNEFPDDLYDLVMISEVAYYLSPTDWKSAVLSLFDRLKSNGNIVLVHWLPEVHDYPQTGDEVHQSFEKLMQEKMTNVLSNRAENYRIDVWEKL
ncbi:class I SAM-dependent methyltransferase [Chryseobacterium formosus]|uniref:Class I SAM-dependent methyltransferase n=1 Tax=Chryseobacterium formosus TaxID=1537363 RepID=A0ABT3XXL3_9FLAO|nr:class I SAM-dependent methyltransferase [Chryseobacterium formosus]MCX8526413.1 class I SAM-dependent methyltransferase [Chryseobacterium formosus]